MRAVEQPVGERTVEPGLAREPARFVACELELQLPELGDFVGRAQPREAERWISRG